MDTANPFECPICYDTYSEESIPTVLPCGHACCISHVRELRECFFCRRAIQNTFIAEPCFALRNGSIKFSTLQSERQVLQLITEFGANPGGNEGANLVSSGTKIIATDESDDKTGTISDEDTTNDSIKEEKKILSDREVAEYFSKRNRELAVSTIGRTSQSILQKKSCGHVCTVSNYQQCCACLDSRPVRDTNVYVAFIDGVGWVENAPRRAIYCAICR